MAGVPRSRSGETHGKGGVQPKMTNQPASCQRLPSQRGESPILIVAQRCVVLYAELVIIHTYEYLHTHSRQMTFD